MDGHRQQRPPNADQDERRHRPPGPDNNQIRSIDTEEVSEQIAHQIDTHAIQERQDHQPQGQGAVSEDAQQGIGGQSKPASQEKQQKGHGGDHGRHAHAGTHAE